MIKFFTQHTDRQKFFREIKEDEIFMYSYSDYDYEAIAKITEEYDVRVEPLKKGTEEYKLYGACAVIVTERSGSERLQVYEFCIDSNIIEIRAESEKIAKLRLLEVLFEKGIIKARQKVI
jgi:hypothetical protein